MFTAGSAPGRSSAFLLVALVLGGLARMSHAADTPTWRVAMLVLVAPNLALIIGLTLAKEPGRSRGSRPALSLYRAALGWLGRHPVAYLCVTTGAAAGVTCVQTLSAWGPSLLHRRFGIPPATAALGFGVALVPAALAGHLGGGWIFDWLKRRGVTPLWPLAGALVLACAGTVAASHAPSPWTTNAALAVAALGASVATLAGLVAMQAISPPDSRAALGALFFAVTSLVGFGVGPFIAGLISDRRGGADPTPCRAQTPTAEARPSQAACSRSTM